MLRLLLIALASVGAASAQPLGTWAAYGLNARFGTTPVSLHNDVQLRSHAALRDFDQAVVRLGLGVTTHGIRLTSGAAASYTEGVGTPDRPRTELRLYQDVSGRHSVGAVRLEHRGRIEERFGRGQRGYLRLRYQIAARCPSRASAGDAGRSQRSGPSSRSCAARAAARATHSTA